MVTKQPSKNQQNLIYISSVVIYQYLATEFFYLAKLDTHGLLFFEA